MADDPTLPTFEIGDQVYERGRWYPDGPATIVGSQVTYDYHGVIHTYDIQYPVTLEPRWLGGNPFGAEYHEYHDRETTKVRRVKAEDLSKTQWPSPFVVTSGICHVATGMADASWFRAPLWGEPVSTSPVLGTDTPVAPVLVRPRLTYSPSEPDPL